MFFGLVHNSYDGVGRNSFFSAELLKSKGGTYQT